MELIIALINLVLWIVVFFFLLFGVIHPAIAAWGFLPPGVLEWLAAIALTIPCAGVLSGIGTIILSLVGVCLYICFQSMSGKG